MRLVIVPALMIILAASSPVTAQVQRDYVFKPDVVELIEHSRQIEGDADVSFECGKFTYWFTNQQNRSAFEKNPAKYEIQMGGACARMGPLSGLGTPRLYAVHDGRLYIFASEQCRATFLRAPEQFIDIDDPPLEADEESRARGRALLGKAVDAVACLAFIDTITSYRETLAQDRESGGKTSHVTNSVTLMFPGPPSPSPTKVRTDLCWDDSCWGHVVDGPNGWSIDNEGTSSLHASQRQEVMRDAGRHFLVILRSRDSADLLIGAREEKRTVILPDEGEKELDLVAVHRDGATTTLGIDEAGRVRLMSYRGRGRNATFGTVERLYSEFHDVSGLRLPGRVDVTFNGEPVPEESGVFQEQVVNDPSDLRKFKHASGA